ncbi:MAG TPA: N-acetyltransferase [Terriglobales bacterium]|nr:N-acetyltransferase [Terriglobales bacterium]
MSPVQVTIRDFHSRDFETLWRIDQQCFAPGISYSRPELAAYMHAAGSFTLVAESQETPNTESPVGSATSGSGEIIGFLVGHANRRGAGHIITIDVLPQARRSGIGSRLLLAAEERLRAAHCSMVRLETAVDNTSALTFYKRHNYSLLRTIPRYYPGGLDAFVLQKNLLSSPSDR